MVFEIQERHRNTYPLHGGKMIKIKIKHSDSERYLNTSNINKFSIQMENRILFNMTNNELIIGENDYEYMKTFNPKSLECFIETISKETQLTTYINKNNICYITPYENECVVCMLNGEKISIEDNADKFLS